MSFPDSWHILMSPLMPSGGRVVLQATALSTPALPACQTSHIAGTPQQEAAPLGVWPSVLTRQRRATRTLDVQKDPLDPQGQSYPLTGPPGTDTDCLDLTSSCFRFTEQDKTDTGKKSNILTTIFYVSRLHRCVSGGSRIPWRVTLLGSMTLAWMLMTLWKKLSKAKTLQMSTILKVQLEFRSQSWLPLAPSQLVLSLCCFLSALTRTGKAS